MEPNWFSSNVNWTRLWWVVGIVTVFWSGLSGLVLTFPAFAKIFAVINVLLTASLAALLFAARGTKYIANRQEPPADGRP